MASDDVMAPLCIILAKGGAHGGKILFKYPYLTPSHQGEPHMTRKTPYALTISEDLLNQRSKVESTNIENGSLVGFKDETLANMFAVSKVGVSIVPFTLIMFRPLQYCSVHSVTVPFIPLLFCSIHFCSVYFVSVPFTLFLFHSLHFCSVLFLFRSLCYCSIHSISVPF